MKKIDETFYYEGKKLLTIEYDGCNGCFFHNFGIGCWKPPIDEFSCQNTYRSDRKSVIFKEIPFKFGK
jgi:hypothetical protein